MRSAFGIEHPEISKGLGELAGTARLQLKAAGQGAKLARLHNKKALSDAGYSRGVKGFKESFQAGMRGQGKLHSAGRKQALRGGKKNTMGDIKDISQGHKPGSIFSPGSTDIMGARMKRGMSQIDTRLR